jgi:chloramphenicol-sensitive protein RarD
MNDTARAPQPSVPGAHRSARPRRAASAFFIWGLLPLYLKLLHAVPVVQITAHRLVWGCLFAFLWLRCVASRPGLGAPARPDDALAAVRERDAHQHQLADVRVRHRREPRGGDQPRLLHQSARQRAARRVAASERLNAAQWTAVAIAAAGVAWLTWTPDIRRGSR